jgi:hypothetical protein
MIEVFGARTVPLNESVKTESRLPLEAKAKLPAAPTVLGADR